MLTGIQYPCRQGLYTCTTSKGKSIMHSAIELLVKYLFRRKIRLSAMSLREMYQRWNVLWRTLQNPPFIYCSSSTLPGRQWVQVSSHSSLNHCPKADNRTLNDRRRAKELKVMRKCGLRMPHPTEVWLIDKYCCGNWIFSHYQEIYYVSAQASSEIYTIAIVEALQFFENAFPTLRQLDRRERVRRIVSLTICLLVQHGITRALLGIHFQRVYDQAKFDFGLSRQ